ncbi:MAG: hypothetical protein ABI557_03805, partial [Aureliella sp.]
MNTRKLLLATWATLICLPALAQLSAADRLVFEAQGNNSPKHIVLVSGDEEYRSEESMPMLGKILSQRHGFKCTVLFALGPDGAETIDSNNSQGIRGFEALDTADLMIIGTRFRKPDSEAAKHIATFLNSGKPVIGIRTSTHAFQGDEDFDGLKYNDFGPKILGETWVAHHGQHKVQGARGVLIQGQTANPILNSVADIFCPSDVYTVSHLTDADQILMRAAVTESLDPQSALVKGGVNSPTQPFAWLHTYQRPDGSGQGKSFCTTGGASVDFVCEDLRRMIVNAAYYLTDRPVPKKADVDFIDAYYPSFFGFIHEPVDYWKTLARKPEDFALGQSPHVADPAGSPEWNFRDSPAKDSSNAAAKTKVTTPSTTATSPAAAKSTDAIQVESADGPRWEPRQAERIALVGNSLAERMNLFGYFETLLHTRFPEKQLVFRNFGWPADEVGKQQRPDNYTVIDDPFQ